MTEPLAADKVSTLVSTFAAATSLNDKWAAARRLMNDRQRGQAADQPLLRDSLAQLGFWAAQGTEIERMIAIDLLVRLPAAIRKLKPAARPLLSTALRVPLPPLSIVSEKRNLPEGAEPAEIRENVASALDEATGDWVAEYVITALAEEDRSQRSRLALARQLSRRLTSIDEWLERLSREESLQSISRTSGLEAAITRLRDLYSALAEVIRTQRYRLSLSVKAGGHLAHLARIMVPLTSAQALPARIDKLAVALLHLLDELIAVRLTLMGEAELYESVQIIHRWWSPLPYPRNVVEAMSPIADKLIAGIVFRGRGGQRSEALLRLLKHALNDEKELDARLSDVLAREPAFSGDVQDWLRGIERLPSRAGSAAKHLEAVTTETFLRAFAPIFLEARERVESGHLDRQSRLLSMINSLSHEYGLQVVGRPGDEADYAPAAYETANNRPPKNPRVKIIRPMVVRRRGDGGTDVVMRGLVEDR